jgi:hypothetical protein
MKAPYMVKRICADFSLFANVITKTCPELPIWQLFLLMPQRKRPYTGRCKGYLDKRTVKKKNCIQAQ